MSMMVFSDYVKALGKEILRKRYDLQEGGG